MDARADRVADGGIAAALLGWYDAHARVLPWRAAPGSPLPDAYRVWLAEVMLQQTTVAAVIPYFEYFTTRWPTVFALAAADDAEVMAAWAGLGYYARARNLIACARAVAAAENPNGAGVFPDSEAGLRALPGIGAYTAAAVAAIGFGRHAVVVDGNVERVVTRLFAIGEALPGAKPAIRTATDAITPGTRPGDFAQAMMDLGATVCTPRGPRCGRCPLAGHCAAARAGRAESFPVKAPKPARPERRGRAFWIERDGAIWLLRRAGKGMLGGMRALPDDGWRAGADGSSYAGGATAGDWRPLGSVTHGFTHFTLTLEVVVVSFDDWAGLAGGDKSGEWWPITKLADAGLPSLFAKAVRLAATGGDEAHR